MITAPNNRLYVVVGVMIDEQKRVLIQQRRKGTPEAGKWEFPGGKLEEGEKPQEALARELYEELGVTVTDSVRLITVAHDYFHANVWLDTYLITKFNAIPVGKEDQKIAWSEINQLNLYDLLPAVDPIIQVLLNKNVFKLGTLK